MANYNRRETSIWVVIVVTVLVLLAMAIWTAFDRSEDMIESAEDAETGRADAMEPPETTPQ